MNTSTIINWLSFDYLYRTRVNLRWKYAWMIVLALFAYLCPFTSQGAFDWNPLHFFYKNSVTAFCLTTPAFLTILTLNIPKINIVTYRITAIIGTIMGIYNMFNFLNPHTVYVGIMHIPLLTISLYCTILSYRLTSHKWKQCLLSSCFYETNAKKLYFCSLKQNEQHYENYIPTN